MYISKKNFTLFIHKKKKKRQKHLIARPPRLLARQILAVVHGAELNLAAGAVEVVHPPTSDRGEVQK